MKCPYCGKDFESQRAIRAHVGAKHKAENMEFFGGLRVVVGNDELDITNKELQRLREGHSNRCEICGKYETANTRPDAKSTPNKLCIDHNHNTNQFRGFICVQCNRNMGWLDRFQKQIEEYNHPFREKEKMNRDVGATVSVSDS